jgi:DNA modification methylase
VSPLIITADAFHIPLASDSVQMVVSSPPYYRLRKYPGHRDDAFGWERTVEQYVRSTIKILREIRRVLMSDGVVFWIIADTYYGSNRGRGSRASKFTPYCEPMPLLGKEAQAKSLCLIPDRIRIAAQNDGWIIRNNIIWQKPNCIPESIKDRCAQCYEHVIVMAPRNNYFWNTAENVEPSICWQKGSLGGGVTPSKKDGKMKFLTMRHGNKPGCSRTEKRLHNFVGGGPKGDAFILEGTHGERSAHRMEIKPTRTLRDVWTIPTYAHKDDHVAIFPEALAERCIRLGSKPGDTVLDPFGGSGTTGAAAERLDRRAILIDLSAEYCESMKRRFAREDASSADDEKWER